MPVLSENELRNALEKLAALLEKKGLLPPGTDKKLIVERVFENLKQNDCRFNAEDLDPKKSALAKTLIMTLILEATSEKTQDLTIKKMLKPNYKILFNEHIPNDLELKNELKNKLSILNQLIPQNRLSEKALDDLADRLVKKIKQSFLKEDNSQKTLSENQEMSDALSDLTTGLVSNYGGIDPRVAGGVFKPVQRIIGNLNAWVDYNPGGNPTASLMAEQNTAEPGKADYTGGEAFTISNAISNGELTETLDVHTKPSNWPPKPNPNGYPY